MDRTTQRFAEMMDSPANIEAEKKLFELAGPRRRTMTLAEQISWQIGKSILEEVYQPGEALTEQNLSKDFGVSRGPVREALRILEREKLVEILPRRGARVTRLSIQEVSEIFDIRAILLGHAARLAAEGGNPECLEALTAGHKVLVDNINGGNDLDVHLAVSVQMNQVLASRTGNERLYEIIFDLARQIARYTRFGLSSDQQRIQSVQTWGELIDHIRNGRGDEAEILERQRVKHVQKYVIESLNAAK